MHGNNFFKPNAFSSFPLYSALPALNSPDVLAIECSQTLFPVRKYVNRSGMKSACFAAFSAALPLCRSSASRHSVLYLLNAIPVSLYSSESGMTLPISSSASAACGER